MFRFLSALKRPSSNLLSNNNHRFYLSKNAFPTSKFSTSTSTDSTNVVSPSSSKTEGSSGEGTGEINTIGRFYQQTLFKGRDHHKFGLGNFKNLCLMCEKPEHAKYVIKMNDIYQVKGNDFSEEIASLFIKALVRCQATRPAMERVAKYKNRIGAWVTATSFHQLVENYIQQHLVEKDSNSSNNEAMIESIESDSTDNEDDELKEEEEKEETSTTTASSSSTSSTTQPPAAAATAADAKPAFVPTRIIIQSKADMIAKLSNDILLMQALDVVVLKGLIPTAKTMELIGSHIGPHTEDNLKYQKYQYIVDKIAKMNLHELTHVVGMKSI